MMTNNTKNVTPTFIEYLMLRATTLLDLKAGS